MTYQFRSLYTKRLNLLRLNAKYIDDLFALRSNERVVKYVEKVEDTSIGQTSEFIQKINEGITSKKWCYWGMVECSSNRLIGTICLWMFNPTANEAEIGFELHPDFQGHGFMTEALDVILKFGFESLGLKKINGFTHQDNIPSIKIMSKFGFEKSKTKDKNVIYTLESPNTIS